MFVAQRHLALRCLKKTFFSNVVLSLSEQVSESTDEGCVLLGTFS